MGSVQSQRKEGDKLDQGVAVNQGDQGGKQVMVLYGIVLYCTILYYTVLYCSIPYYTVLYCTILYYTVLYRTVQVVEQQGGAGGGARWSKEQGGAEAISWILLCSQDDVFMFDIKTLGEEAWMWSKEQGGREGAENGVDYQVWSSVQCPVSSGIWKQLQMGVTKLQCNFCPYQSGDRYNMKRHTNFISELVVPCPWSVLWWGRREIVTNILVMDLSVGVRMTMNGFVNNV